MARIMADQTYLRKLEELTRGTGDVETVLLISSILEKVLRERWGAQGRGLGQMAREVQKQVGARLAEEIRRFARLRNKAAHEAVTFRLYDRQKTLYQGAEIYTQLMRSQQRTWVEKMMDMGISRRWLLHSLVWMALPVTALFYLPWVSIQQSKGRWRRERLKKPLTPALMAYLTVLFLMVKVSVFPTHAGLIEMLLIAASIALYVLICAAIGIKMVAGMQN